MTPSPIRAALVAMALVATACSASAGPPRTRPTTTTTIAPTTTTVTSSTATIGPDTTSTTASSTTTTTRAPLAYFGSDDYTVETVAVIEGASPGGLLFVDGSLLSADFGSNDRIGDHVYQVHLDGTVEVFAQITGMDRGTSMAIGSGGIVLLSSFLTGLVFELGDDGQAEVHTDAAGAPAGLTVASNGNVYIGDCAGDRIMRLRGDRPPFAEARDDSLACPTGVSIDPSGNIYTAGFNTGLVQRIATNSERTVVHEFSSNNSDVLYSNGRLFVTGREDHVVYRIDLASGLVDVIAGTGWSGVADGPGSMSTLARPQSLALGPDGTIYVSHAGAETTDTTVIRALIPVRDDDA